ncbi:DNA alkylation repair protein, partial [Patescibacteria group bacterium]|nr:DNA alkylation repair protein [Patescibacteria group bacterium]
MNSKQIIGQIRKELKNKADTKTEEEREKARALFGNETKLLALKVPETRKLAESFAKKLIQDEDDMVQKGVGWLLKEAGGRFPDETVKFLMKWRQKIPRLVL